MTVEHALQGSRACFRAMLASAILALAAGPALAAPSAGADAPVALDALVERALTQVPALEAAEATARAQRAREGVAGSSYWPQLALASNYSRLNGVFPAPFNGAPLDNGATNVTVRQVLSNFGQTDAQLAAARATADAGAAQARAAAVQVAFNVRQAYLQWAQARALSTQTDAQVRNAEQVLARAQSFYRHGVRPRIDVTRAEVVLAQAQAMRVDARNQVELARRSLETALGGETVAGVPVFPKEPALLKRSPSEWTTLARAHHPNLLAGAALARNAEANRQLAQRLAYPELSANAAGGLRTQAWQTAPNWQAGIGLAMPLFTGFSISRQQEAAVEAERAALADLREREQQVRLGVDRAGLALGGARERLAALRVALKSAHENFTLAQNRYRDGVGSIIEVSDAQTLLSGAEAEVVRGTGTYHLAIAELERALGRTGLEPETTTGEDR